MYLGLVSQGPLLLTSEMPAKPDSSGVYSQYDDCVVRLQGILPQIASVVWNVFVRGLQIRTVAWPREGHWRSKSDSNGLLP